MKSYRIVISGIILALGFACADIGQHTILSEHENHRQGQKVAGLCTLVDSAAEAIIDDITMSILWSSTKPEFGRDGPFSMTPDNYKLSLAGCQEGQAFSRCLELATQDSVTTSPMNIYWDVENLVEMQCVDGQGEIRGELEKFDHIVIRLLEYDKYNKSDLTFQVEVPVADLARDSLITVGDENTSVSLEFSSPIYEAVRDSINKER